MPTHLPAPRSWILAAVAAACLAVAGAWLRGSSEGESKASSPLPGPSLADFATRQADEAPRWAADACPGSGTCYETEIRRPSGPPRIQIAAADPAGRVGSVACSTCHSVRPPEPRNRTPADLTEFHQQMPFAHGQLACFACHNPDDYDTLRLADGTAVEYSDVMTLCAQCHGSQADAYAHGAHGGMTGYWDLSRGSRTRNHCIDCHDPHAPAFPKMVPTFKPRDRFLGDSHETHPAPAGALFAPGAARAEESHE